MPSILLADLLGQHLQRTHTSVNRLAKLSGIPQRTIANWLNGFIKKPHQWQSLVKVASALHLNPAETDELLLTAEHPSLSELSRTAASRPDKDLLSNFHPSQPRKRPFQAIADLSTFVGRTSEIKDLKRILLNGGRAAICSLRGMGGVGKTSLAAHLAYQFRDEFPDGVLWARLDTSDTLSILGAFADAYGKDVNQYKDIESRASVVRNLLAEKQVLIVLDNAETSAQVRPLLPPSTGNSAILITTRRNLSVLDGWTQVRLEPFDTASQEALELFEVYLGRNFVRVNNHALLETAELLGYLPLALAIAAGRLADDLLHPQRQKEGIVERFLDSLRETRTRLNVLTRDDMEIRASFDMSYTSLPTRQKELFAALGIFSGEDFGSDSVAYLMEETPATVEKDLQRLQALSLVQEGHGRRWRLHPLLRDYAREQLEATNRTSMVVEKTLFMYQQTAQGQWSFIRPLDAEIPNIRFALDQAIQLKLYKTHLETVQAIIPILGIGAWFSLARSALEQARGAAHALGDSRSDFYLLKDLSHIQMELGDNKGSRDNLHLALQLARSTNQEEDIADILCTLGKLEQITGYRKQSNIHFEESLALARKLEAHYIVGRNLNNMGLNLKEEGRHKEAERLFLDALRLFNEHGFEDAAFIVLMNLGDVYSAMEDWDRAGNYWQESLALARSRNHRSAVSGMLVNMAEIHEVRHEWDEARRCLNEAIRLAHEINSPRGESIARSELGQLFRRQKNFNEAFEQLDRSHELAVEAGDVERKGIILRYLGLLYLDLTQLEKAQAVLDEALSSAKEIESEIMIADICFVLAKVAFAGGKRAKAKKWARESLAVYEQLNLARQLEEVRRWLASPHAGVSPGFHAGGPGPKDRWKRTRPPTP